MKLRHDLGHDASRPAEKPLLLQARQRVTANRAGRLRSALVTGAALAAVWAGLHWDDPASWVIGLPSALAGAAATALLPASPPPHLSLTGAVRLALFAVSGILRGALDVSRLSLRPGRLRAGCIRIVTRLPEGRPRRLFALTITLLPGTLTARIDGNRLVVHALDCGPATRRDLDALETRIAGLFGLPLDGDLS